MKKFLALYMANAAEMADMMKKSTPEQQKKGMEGWMKWILFKKLLLLFGFLLKTDRQQLVSFYKLIR